MTEDKTLCNKCFAENTAGIKFCVKCGSTLVTKRDKTDITLKEKPIVSDRYEIIKELGRGGMGIVYKAFDHKLERHVALKTLMLDKIDSTRLDSMRNSLISEAKAVAKLKHPNIVGVYDVGAESKSTFVVMEYIDGFTLSPKCDQEERPNLTFIVNIIVQICNAMSHAHKRGIIHCDLKPENIMLENDMDVKITDFGIAKIIQEHTKKDIKKEGIKGTPHYMAPERYKGVQDDLRSDIFAIGVIMYCLLTGNKPFEGFSVEEIRKNVLKGHYKPICILNPSIPEQLDDVVGTALAKDPSFRFQNAEEFKEELLMVFDEGKDVVPSRKIEKIFNVPFHRNRNFTGREEVLSRIDEELSTEKNLTIHGMGGMGKSQTVTEYAYRHADDYKIIWWIRSEDPSSIGSDYASLAEPLGLPSIAMKENEVVDIVKGKLEREEEWLLIFDNAENPEDVRDYFPKAQKGHILITSRNPNWGGVVSTLSLDQMTPEESVEFLLKRTKDKDKKAAEELAEKLGFLPLALEQAGSYIETSGRSVSEYLEMYQKYQEKLLSRGKPTDYPDTVSTTWEISFQRIIAKFKKAVELMNLFAFLGPVDIPINILAEGAEHLPESLSALVTDPFEFDDAITVLRNYSLIKRHQNNLSIHRLLQAVVRDRLSEDEKKIWAESALRLLKHAFVFDSNNFKTWEICSSLQHHVHVVVEHTRLYGIAMDLRRELLNKMGLYFENSGQYTKARRVLEDVLDLGEKSYGHDHPEIAKYLNDLGITLRELGEFDSARKHLERAVKIGEKIYGSDNSKVTVFLRNLASVLKEIGELETALKLVKRTLEIDEKEFGENHLNVALDVNYTGIILKELGEMESALSHFERALIIVESIYGHNHQVVATRISNLGGMYWFLGKFDSARKHIERAIEISKSIYGPNHPHVATYLNNLGLVLRELGELDTAEQHFKRALKIDEMVYGSNHYKVARDLHSLGLYYLKARDPGKAKEHFEKALEISRMKFGENHPKTKKVREDLLSISK